MRESIRILNKVGPADEGPTVAWWMNNALTCAPHGPIRQALSDPLIEVQRILYVHWDRRSAAVHDLSLREARAVQ